MFFFNYRVPGKKTFSNHQATVFYQLITIFIIKLSVRRRMFFNHFLIKTQVLPLPSNKNWLYDRNFKFNKMKNRRFTGDYHSISTIQSQKSKPQMIWQLQLSWWKSFASMIKCKVGLIFRIYLASLYII